MKAVVSFFESLFKAFEKHVKGLQSAIKSALVDGFNIVFISLLTAFERQREGLWKALEDLSRAFEDILKAVKRC